LTRAGKTTTRQTLARRAEGKPGKRKAPTKRKRIKADPYAAIEQRQASRHMPDV
jgi:hypothetical protein